MEPKKYEYIDSLRGIAILLVIIVHTGYNLDNSMFYFPLGAINTIFYCQYGVQLFFIVSAFTLALSYHSRLGEAHQTRNFFIRRYFRIAPMFYFAMLANMVIRGQFADVSWLRIFSSLTFTSTLFGEPYHDGYVPGGWTISVEFIFYALLPLLCARIKSLNSSLAFVLVALVVSASWQPFFDRIGLGEEMRISYFSIFYQLPIFALGILAYWLVTDREKGIKAPTALLVAATAVIFCYVDFPLNFAFSIAFLALLLALYIRPYRLLTNKVLARIGLVSYSMYVIHFIVIHVLNETKIAQMVTVTNIQISILNFILMYVIIVGLSFGIASLTYKFIEVPGQNLGRKIIKKLNQK